MIMTRRILSLLLFGLFLTPAAFNYDGRQETFDLLVINARIIDGTGNPWFYGSVGVRDGMIAAIGDLDPKNAKQVVDAEKNIVSPGFIDVHAHTEEIFENPKAENFIRMGVTSVITGNCGNSEDDPGEFLGRIKDEPLAVNLGTLIGHGAVRKAVVGLDDREPTRDEQLKMNELVERGMRDGALGLSTGLIYVPGTFAKTAEVIELARSAAKYNGVYASHIRDEGIEVVAAIDEAINIGETAKMPVQISHFKIASKNLWGKSDLTIGLVAAARKRGVQVTVDQYAYTASSTSLDARLPAWAIAGGREEGAKRIEDPETRKKIISDIKKYLRLRGFEDFSFAYVSNYKPNADFNGKNIVEITKMTRGTDDLDAQIEQIFEMYPTGRVQMVYHMMDESDVQNIMRQPFTMFAADSGVRRYGSGVPHPRGYGNNARVLGKYVRELGIITLEEAVRKMTSLPAQTFGLADRGLLKRGMAADIVIFDEKTVTDKAGFENPHQYSEGFRFVIVNGKMVVSGGAMTGEMPGAALMGKGIR